ncbi:MAG: glycosyltransferase [Chloroflexaceae bacterium]|nr:glycosyltransferase [Chloroflexaceae bacterium]
MNDLEAYPSPADFWPQVSVIVPIYNGEADVPALIGCLRRQTYPQNRVEYLLVDNNSQDGTLELLKAAAQTAQEKGENWQALSENQIQSSYAARNCGIKASQGEILAFTDADCRPEPQWLEELIKPFSDRQIGIVVGELMAFPGTSLLERYAALTEVMSQRFLLEHPFCPYGQTANLAIRRSALGQVGLFRPYLTTGGDADICWRIQRETHWQLTSAPQAVIAHRHRANFPEFRSQWRRYGRSNRYLHELYGVDLMPELTWQGWVYRLSRWLVKDLPRLSLKVLAGREPPLKLIQSPIDLLGYQSRTEGQRQAQLPDRAREIEPFGDRH